ncbi:MAG TPA: Rieske (2Fe-2S) protein [Symbiobacteriaceae bacterium]|nr:Rieske (2Fe-2S) protein [Symbiobacteriaceae bacterium]
MKRLRMWWAMAAILVAMLGIAAQSVLAFPMPDPTLVISLKDLPVASEHRIPDGLRMRTWPGGRPTHVLVSLGEDGVWRAFPNRSTHLGEPVVWNEQHGRWLDYISGAMWDRDGRPVAGPAPRGLDWYPVSVEGDVLVVDLSRPQFGR